MNHNIIPWIEKYRPIRLDDIVAHTHIIKSLKIYTKKETLPNMIFYGPPGTGKTSTIISYAKQLYKEYFSNMVLELNASDDRGKNIVRITIKDFVSSYSNFCNIPFKLVILDEVDAMTYDAQMLMRGIMEKYSNNARFCLICNNIKDINRSLISRCVIFRFIPIPKKNITKRIKNILQEENIEITNNALDLVYNTSDGDMRTVLNICQSLKMIYKHKVSLHNVIKCFGFITTRNLNKIIDLIINNEIKISFFLLKNIILTEHISFIDIINNISSIFLDNLIENKNFYNLNIPFALKKLSLLEVNFYSQININILISLLISIFT